MSDCRHEHVELVYSTSPVGFDVVCVDCRAQLPEDQAQAIGDDFNATAREVSA